MAFHPDYCRRDRAKHPGVEGLGKISDHFCCQIQPGRNFMAHTRFQNRSRVSQPLAKINFPPCRKVRRLEIRLLGKAEK